jgi:hypothetical protein
MMTADQESQFGKVLEEITHKDRHSNRWQISSFLMPRSLDEKARNPDPEGLRHVP